MTKIGDSPCYRCPDRHLGCHSNCTHDPSYQEYMQMREKLRAERLKEADARNGDVEAVRKIIKRRTNKWGGEG